MATSGRAASRRRVFSGSDITELRQAESRLRFLATRDPLTGLLNRAELESRLGETPATVLKLDRALVSAVTSGPRARTLLAALVRIADAFELQPVAEGVEDAATAKVLDEVGVDPRQGFLYGQAVPLADLGPWLDRLVAPS